MSHCWTLTLLHRSFSLFILIIMASPKTGQPFSINMETKSIQQIQTNPVKSMDDEKHLLEEILQQKELNRTSSVLCPSVVSSDESSVEEETSLHEGPAPSTTAVPSRGTLQWKFFGYSLWLELEEYDSDLSNAIHHFSQKFGVEPMPCPHLTAIYGMKHLSVEDAIAKLDEFVQKVPKWPSFGKPISIVQDIAIDGNPGQVCTIAWAELKFASNPHHEDVLDTLFEIFYGPDHNKRTGPWTPHNSMAYDNPDDSPLNLLDVVLYAASVPTLLGKPRRVNAISLWDTNGTMGEWKPIHRVEFQK